jgi:Leucine-rich repeat (LRR) protein
LEAVNALDLSRNGLEELPPIETILAQLYNATFNPSMHSFFKSNLVELCLQDNLLTELPEELFIGMSSLAKLDLSNNSLIELPETLIYCINLTTLKLGSVYGGNNLTAISPSLFRGLKKLQELDLSQNNLKNLCQEIGSLVLLKHLNISKNVLIDLPSSISRLRNLQSLNVSYNQLKHLSPTLSNLSETLEIFDLSHNRLQFLPACLLKKLSRTVILLTGNTFETLAGQIQMDEQAFNPNLPSLFELSARSLVTSRYVTPNFELPERLKHYLSGDFQECCLCSQVFVNEWYSCCLKSSYKGHPNIPQTLNSCSLNCIQQQQAEINVSTVQFMRPHCMTYPSPPSDIEEVPTHCILKEN